MSLHNKMDYGFSYHNQNSIVFPDENIAGSIIEKNINNEVFIMKSSLEFKKTIEIKSSSDIDGVILGYNLLGTMEHRGVEKDYNLKLMTNDSNLSIVKNENSISIGHKGLLNKLSFVIKKDFIKKNITDNKIKDFILSSLERDMCQDFIFERKTNDYLQRIIQDIYKLDFEEGLNNLYLQAKMLELFFLEFNTLADKKSSSKNVLKLDDFDIEAIKKAKDILIQNMQNPPSIIELSRMVAINDFKLKKGFKEVFGITPYNLLVDYRLELAKKIFQEGDMNINEIAEYIGYKYTQSFSRAFMQKYGIQPKKLMKNRKYYY